MSGTIRGRVLPVLLGAAVIAGAANLTAYAANGHALLLGHGNTESSTTTVSRSGHGPAVSFRTATKSAPFAVNGTKVVKHLNADTLDGRHASTISHAFRYVLPKNRVLGVAFLLSDLPKGTYLASYQVATVNNTDSPTVCQLADDRSSFALVSYGVSGPAADAGEDQVEISTASGLVTVKHEGHAEIGCSNGDKLFNDLGVQNAVTLTPVVATTKGHLKDIAERGAEPGKVFGR
jgi:hypothetical protein